MPERLNILKYEKELSLHNPFKQIYGHKFHVHMHQTVKINDRRAALLQPHSCCTEMIRTVRTLRTHSVTILLSERKHCAFPLTVQMHLADLQWANVLWYMSNNILKACSSKKMVPTSE
jgi:hypothetical protein